MLTFCRRFLHDRKGGVAIALALAMVPLLGAAGAAIDYGRSIDMRTKMQKGGRHRCAQGRAGQ